MEAPQTHCKSHPHRMAVMNCLDCSCDENDLFCVECISGIHKNCDIKLIIANKENNNLIQILPQKHDLASITRALNRLGEELVQHYIAKLVHLKKTIISSFKDRYRSDKNITTKSDLEELKRYYTVDKELNANKISFVPKTDRLDLQDIHDKLREFKEEGKRQVNYLLDRMNKLYPFRDLIHKDLWVANKGSERVEIRTNDSLIRREENLYQISYTTVINSIPLTEACSFKITVKNIWAHRRSMMVGLIDQTVFNASKYDCVLKNVGDIMFFDGFRRNGGLQGVQPATDPQDPKGFTQGTEIFLKYIPNKEIVIYNEKGDLNLSRSMIGKEGPYYLFIIPYHQKNRCVIERIV